jgi:Mn-dependent DtxR family transcriptional regulator
MLNKLREEQFIVHEKYGGIILTEKGSSMADEIRQRHGLLVNFLRLLGADETRAQKDTEGLEHYIDTRTLGLLAKLVEYASRNPQWWNQFQKHSENI